jgi:acetylornithine/N-succinyldiaminopimelate aminotransferase
MMVAKGIGGGFPIGAVLATKDAANGMTAGTHGSTYGGNPLGCAVGSTVLNHVSDPEFLSDVNRKSGLLHQGLGGLIAEFPDIFDEIIGLGLMVGLRCKVNNMDVVKAGYDAEILTVPAAENVVRLLPALNIADEDIKVAVDRLRKAATSLQSDV